MPFSSLKISLFLALVITLFALTMDYFRGVFFTPKSIILNIILFFFTLLTALFLIKKYIQSQINKIYKKIGLLKKSNQNQLMTKNGLIKIESNILHFVNKRHKEIERLKKNEEYRKEFIGNLAHELKTPIFSVQGYILTLLEGGLEDDKINRKFLMKASKGIDRITTIINDMDTITKIESGILELNLKQFNVLELIKDVFSELEETAKERKIELILANITTSSISVIGDRARLTQVLYNLITNSIYYGKTGGKTIVTIKPTKNKVFVEVEDNGKGIEKKHLARLFERFYRIEKSRSRNKGGSGIGLAIVKHIIEVHNQKIKVESEINKGTIFTFTLDKV